MWVTRFAGALTSAQNFAPRPLAENVARLLGAERNFMGAASAPSRRSYEARIRAQ